MRYFTKEYYAKASISSIIPNCLTVIPEDEYDFDSLLQRRIAQYASIEETREKLRQEMLRINPEIPLQSAMPVVQREYEGHLKLLERYLDTETKKKIRDIRVLALRYVTAEENIVMHAWRRAYQEEAKRLADEYESYYQRIESRLTDTVKAFMEYYIFDMKCENEIVKGDRYTISYGDDEAFAFHFQKAKILARNGRLDFMEAREVYLNDDGSYQIHLLFEKGEITLECADVTITDVRKPAEPIPGSVRVDGGMLASPPKAFRNTVIMDDVDPFPE